MNETQFNRLLTVLERIASAIKFSNRAAEPRYTKPISEYKNFNWGTIGATIDKADRYGPAVLCGQEHLYVKKRQFLKGSRGDNPILKYLSVIACAISGRNQNL